MNRDDQARLDIAYEAWRAAAPTDGQVEAGARRVAAALARAPIRRRSRLVPVIVGATALCAALAYAATGPLGTLLRGEQPAPNSGPRTKKPERVVTLPSPPPRTAPAPRLEARQDDAAGAPQGDARLPARDPESPASRAGAVHKRDAKVAGVASWHDVDQALARGDDRAARAALAGLDKQATDDDTRAKSRLGLAQLALSRGDCEEVRRVALSVLVLSGADAKYHQQARDLAARCGKDGD
ncbi:MAG: hypothetical protein JW940_35420 [Polyangiaceae bacterium]|nr:hypothetical protein [Polyangiaceae bacterium]